jgi:hypothetical protein
VRPAGQREARAAPRSGGRTNRPLNVAYRVARQGQRHGDRQARVQGRAHGALTGRAARRTHRLRVPAERLRKGVYTVTISVVAGSRRASTTLSARRL